MMIETDVGPLAAWGDKQSGRLRSLNSPPKHNLRHKTKTYDRFR